MTSSQDGVGIVSIACFLPAAFVNLSSFAFAPITQLSDFQYFRADTDLIFRYFLIIISFSKVCNLRFLEKKAGAEMMEFLSKLLSSVPQLLAQTLCVSKRLPLRCCSHKFISYYISIFTRKYHVPSMDDVIDV